MMTFLSVMVCKGIDAIPDIMPKSFTYGELAVVLQLLSSCLCRVVSGVTQVRGLGRKVLTINRPLTFSCHLQVFFFLVINATYHTEIIIYKKIK